MSPGPNPFSFLRRRPLLALTLGLATGFVLLSMYLRFWITTDAGRDFIVSQIDGRNVAGYGRLSVRHLEGDPLSEFTLGNISIRDASGDWLTAQTVRIAWSPASLLSRTIDLETVSISELSVHRRPVREPQPGTQPAPWDIRLRKGAIDRLLLAKGVAGPASAFRLDARFLNERSGRVDALLELKPLDGAGDQVTAEIMRERTSAFDVTLDVNAPAGGVFAHLLRLPEGASATVAAQASGDLQAGLGEARLTIDGTDKVFLSGKIENRQLEASTRIDAGALPLPARLAQWLGSAGEADLSASFEDDRIRFRTEARIAAGVVSFSGLSALNPLMLLEPVRVDARLSSLSPYWEAADTLTFSGSLAPEGGGWRFAGDTDLSVLAGYGLPFDSLKGPLSATLAEGQILFTGDMIVRNLLSSNAQAARIIGPDLRISANGAFSLTGRRLVVNAAEVTHRSGDAQLLGEISFDDGQINVSGKVTQFLSPLPAGIGGQASGFVQLKGRLRDLELGLNLTLERLASDNESLNALIQGQGALRGLIRITPEAAVAERVDFRLQGIEGRLSGAVSGSASPDLVISAQQRSTIVLAGIPVDLGAVTARLKRHRAGLRIDVDTDGGKVTVSGRTVPGLSTTSALLLKETGVSGPISLAARVDALAATASFELHRSDGITRLEKVAGTLGSVGFTGSAKLPDKGVSTADLDVEAGAFEYAGISVGSLKLSANARKAADESADIAARVEASMVKLTPDLSIEKLTGTLSGSADGYRLEGRLLDTQEGSDSDVSYSGSLSLDGGHPSGTLALTGRLLGVAIASQEDIAWSLGPTPGIDADLALLDGQLKASVRSGRDAAKSTLTLSNLKVAPLLGALGLPEIDALVSGRASGRLFGDDPEGAFMVSAMGALPGLSTELDLDLIGRLDRRYLTLTAEASYGPDLKANAAGRLPVVTSAARLVQLDRSRPIEAVADVNGDLDALRLASLAFGHDIGGALKSRFRINGTLELPVYTADIDIADGIYEYGATGLSLKDLDVQATYANQALTLTGAALGSNGGSVKLNGRLAEDEAGVTVELDRLLIYDRLGDQARISGTARLIEGEKDRLFSGNLTVNEARFNIDRFSARAIRTLNVRWTTDEPRVRVEPILEKPIRLGLKVTAARGVFIRGRGLESDWGVSLDVSGKPDDVRLNGRATLFRGSLELARKPFEFESGTITFDGPISSARMAISARREVDGFSVRADVSGAPARPSVNLSSSPSLPEDEILSRMLFGRSSFDLSAIEAAELAASIARLAGQDTRIDPIGAIQAGLGVDRLRLGMTSGGNAEVGVGQYLSPDVYLEVTSRGAEGNSVEVEWQPQPHVSISSTSHSTGDSRISVRWKKDY